MRYKEFSKNISNKKTLEVSPTMQTVGGTSQKTNALSTSSNVARPIGTSQAQTGPTSQLSTTKQNQQQNQQQNQEPEKQQVQLKPGMNILQPALSRTPIKVKTISGSGNEVELDTQKILGHNIKVKQPELMAVLNQLGNKK